MPNKSNPFGLIINTAVSFLLQLYRYGTTTEMLDYSKTAIFVETGACPVLRRNWIFQSKYAVLAASMQFSPVDALSFVKTMICMRALLSGCCLMGLGD